jgi:hypothetical protein
MTYGLYHDPDVELKMVVGKTTTTIALAWFAYAHELSVTTPVPSRFSTVSLVSQEPLIVIQ